MSRREDADRMSSYNYADRRDGEKNRHNARVRSPLRDKRTRDRSREWERDYDRGRSPGAGARRYSADVRHNHRDGPYRGERHQHNGSSSPPRGPATYRQQEAARGPGIQRSLTAPSPTTLKTGPQTTPSPQSYLDTLLRLSRNVVTLISDRALLKRRKQELEKALSRLRIDHEKSAPKHADFPSVRDTHNRETERLNHEMEAVNRELDQNNNTLNNEIRILLEKILDSSSQSPASHVDGDSSPGLSDVATSRLDALEKRMIDREKAWAEKEAACVKQQEELSKQADRLSTIENDMSAAKGLIQTLVDENAALKAQLQSVADSSLPKPVEDTSGPEALQGLQTSVDDTRSELRDLAVKVDKVATTLADIDVDFVIESCQDINVKLPTLENSINKLRGEVQSIPPPPDTSNLVTAEQLEESCNTIKGRQNAVAVKLGTMMKEFKDDTDARILPLEEVARQSSLTVGAQPPADRSGSVVPETGYTDEARKQALEQARQDNDAIARSSDSGAHGDTANRLQALEDRVLSHEGAFMTIAKTEEQETVWTKAVQNVLERTNTLNERCGSSEAAQQHIQKGVNDLGVKVEEIVKQISGKLEALLLSFNVLDSQYNNLSTEGLAQAIGRHIQDQRDDAIAQLQHDINRLGSLLAAIDQRVTSLEQVQRGRGPGGEVLGNNKRGFDMPPALANGRH